MYSAGVELVGGALLILGLKRDWAVFAILSVLVIVTFGKGMGDAVWDIEQTMRRMGLLTILLLLPPEGDRLRLDWLIRFRSE